MFNGYKAKIETTNSKVIREIKSAEELQNIKLNGHYSLSNDIDLGKYNWKPIGSKDNPFKGSLNGNNKAIKGLHIRRVKNNYVALFGAIGDNAKIENLVIMQVQVLGNNNVGALAGSSSGGVVSNVRVGKGIIKGVNNVGGLIGENDNSVIKNSYTSVSVTGDMSVGGLSGINLYGFVENSFSNINVKGNFVSVGGLIGSNCGCVSNSYSKGVVRGGDDVGGLVGYNENNGIIKGSYSMTKVTGYQNIGGLVGVNLYGRIERSHSQGDVNGESDTGGLIGWNKTGIISNSYFLGTVTGKKDNIGGLIGYNKSGVVENSYSKTTINGNIKLGGLCGSNRDGAIRNSYARVDIRGRAYMGGLIGENYKGYIRNSYAFGYISNNKDKDNLANKYNASVYHSVMEEELFDNPDISNYIPKDKTSLNESAEDKSIGGIVGRNAGTILGCYFGNGITEEDKGSGNDNTLSDITSYKSKNGEVNNNGRLVTEKDFHDWNFRTIWKLQEKGKWPILKWEK